MSKSTYINILVLFCVCATSLNSMGKTKTMPPNFNYFLTTAQESRKMTKDFQEKFNSKMEFYLDQFFIENSNFGPNASPTIYRRIIKHIEKSYKENGCKNMHFEFEDVVIDKKANFIKNGRYAGIITVVADCAVPVNDDISRLYASSFFSWKSDKRLNFIDGETKGKSWLGSDKILKHNSQIVLDVDRIYAENNQLNRYFRSMVAELDKYFESMGCEDLHYEFYDHKNGRHTFFVQRPYDGTLTISGNCSTPSQLKGQLHPKGFSNWIPEIGPW